MRTVTAAEYHDLFSVYCEARRDPGFGAATASSRTNDKATTRFVKEREAAEGLGIPLSVFRNWVASERLPPPLPEIDKWDTKALDAALDRISGVGGPSNALDLWRERR